MTAAFGLALYEVSENHCELSVDTGTRAEHVHKAVG